jgi:hypothetical protein
VVDAPIIHVGEQATDTSRHIGEHVANTLRDDKVDKLVEMDVVAIEDLGFGNEDLDCGSRSEELPQLGKEKTSPACVVTKVNLPFHMQGLDSKEIGNLSDVQVLEVKRWRLPTRT